MARKTTPTEAAAAPAPTKGKFARTAAAPAPAPKAAKAASAGDGETAPKVRGEDRSYKVLAAECPFRQGTIREELWDHIVSSSTTGEARSKDSKISTNFMNELAGKGVIKYTD